MTKQEWRDGSVPSLSNSCTEPQEHHTRVLVLLPSFSSTKNTTAASQGRKSNPATEHGRTASLSLRISYQVTSLQLQLAILGNSLLPLLPSITKHLIQHLGGAVPHCLGTFHSFFFPPAIHSELFYEKQHNINVPSL